MRFSIPASAAADPRTGAAPTRSLARSPLFVAACAALLLMVAAGLFAALVAPFSPTAIDAVHVFQGPSPRHPFGTDRFGRDLLSRIVFGVRVSLGIAGASIALALAVGGVLGLLAGLGRGVDQVLGRAMDVFFAFPPVLLAIGIAAVLGAGPGTAVAAIAVVYAPLFFRVVRASVLAESAEAYVEAAEALGLGRPSSWRNASSSLAWRNVKPEARSRAGSTRALARRSSSAIWPKSRRAATAGSGRSAGRRRTRPSVRASSRLVTGSGATAFTGPARDSVANAWRIAPTRSSIAIQLTHWAPRPTGPPAPRRNGVSIAPRAPPRRLSTMPILSRTTRIPARAAGSVAASHSRQTSARKPGPGALSSRRISEPRSP